MKKAKKKIPTFKTDREAEEFVASSDLTEYDLSGFTSVSFEKETKSKSINNNNQPIQAKFVRYIKLGRGGSWEDECLNNGIIRLGFSTEKQLSLCLAGKWKEYAKLYEEKNKTRGVVTNYTNQVRSFFEDDGTTLWITFHKRQMWWTFMNPSAQAVVHPDGHGTFRKTKNGWKSLDIKGLPLNMDMLSGRITKVVGYQGTICEVKEPELVLRKLNAEITPEAERAKKSRSDLWIAVIDMLRLLTWRDFETLVDLIFSTSGWRRLSIVGGHEKTIDIELILPTTGERAFIQVKSETNQQEFDEYQDQFLGINQFDKMFFVYHTSKFNIKKSNANGIIVIGPERLAEMVLEAGLVSWLIQKIE
jgi:hypothetical protein